MKMPWMRRTTIDHRCVARCSTVKILFSPTNRRKNGYGDTVHSDIRQDINTSTMTEETSSLTHALHIAR